MCLRMLDQFGGILDDIIGVLVERLGVSLEFGLCDDRPILFTRFRPVAAALVQASEEIPVIGICQAGGQELLQRRDRVLELVRGALSIVDASKDLQILRLAGRLLARALSCRTTL